MQSRASIGPCDLPRTVEARRGSLRQRVLLNDPPTTKTNDPRNDLPNFGSPGLAAVAG